MIPEYETRVTGLMVNMIGHPVFSELATHISIADEAAGEFITITQDSDYLKPGQIRMTVTEWPHIKAAIDRMMADVREVLE